MPIEKGHSECQTKTWPSQSKSPWIVHVNSAPDLAKALASSKPAIPGDMSHTPEEGWIHLTLCFRILKNTWAGNDEQRCTTARGLLETLSPHRHPLHHIPVAKYSFKQHSSPKIGLLKLKSPKTPKMGLPLCLYLLASNQLHFLKNWGWN